MLAAPPDDAVARFKRDLLALIGEEGERYGLAVSGGPDSVAMLLLATAAFPGQVEVMTVDHGLRTASAAEARFVADLCHSLDVPHRTSAPGKARAGNSQANARDFRYARLEDWRHERSLDWLLTGHHADDQLETVIMRLNRGAGVDGLAGIRRRQGQIVRPLLGWRRAELAGIVGGCGVVPVDDPSNRDARFDRARLRRALAECDWLDPLAVTQSAAHLDDAAQALAAVSASEPLADLPWELRRRRLIEHLKAVDPAATPRGATLTRLDETLGSGGTMTVGRVLCSGRGGVYRFAPAPPRRIKEPQ